GEMDGWTPTPQPSTAVAECDRPDDFHPRYGGGSDRLLLLSRHGKRLAHDLPGEPCNVFPGTVFPVARPSAGTCLSPSHYAGFLPARVRGFPAKPNPYRFHAQAG